MQSIFGICDKKAEDTAAIGRIKISRQEEIENAAANRKPKALLQKRRRRSCEDWEINARALHGRKAHWKIPQAEGQNKFQVRKYRHMISRCLLLV